MLLCWHWDSEQFASLSTPHGQMFVDSLGEEQKWDIKQMEAFEALRIWTEQLWLMSAVASCLRLQTFHIHLKLLMEKYRSQTCCELRCRNSGVRGAACTTWCTNHDGACSHVMLWIHIKNEHSGNKGSVLRAGRHFSRSSGCFHPRRLTSTRSCRSVMNPAWTTCLLMMRTMMKDGRAQDNCPLRSAAAGDQVVRSPQVKRQHGLEDGETLQEV